MSFTVHVRPEAEEDIEDAAKWYEKQRTNLGQEFLDEILHSFEIISSTPKVFPTIYKHTHRIIAQRFPFGIYYQIEKHYIIVIAVLHGSRHPKKWKRRS